MNEELYAVEENLVRNHPLLLLTLKNKESIKYVNSLLPFSIGIEIECHQKGETFKFHNFRGIPNIMDVNIDEGEQRFRIPAGINGFICLYQISETLKEVSMLTNSGIHYHVGLEHNYRSLVPTNVEENSYWILSELDTWKYPGTYNERKCEFGGGGVWVRFQDYFKTMEVRIGEMTFDYEVLVNRILHLASIVKRLIGKIGGEWKEPTDGILRRNDILSYQSLTTITEEQSRKMSSLYEQLQNLRKEAQEINGKIEEPTDEIKQIINNRIIKL
jgi:hypothetical protein